VEIAADKWFPRPSAGPLDSYEDALVGSPLDDQLRTNAGHRIRSCGGVAFTFCPLAPMCRARRFDPMFRRVILSTTVVLAASGTALGVLAISGPASAKTAPYDNSTDTVSCASFFGTVKISPPLSAAGGSATSLAVKGTLNGCTDGNKALNPKGGSPGGSFTAKVKGTLNGQSNNIATLAGCATNAGALTIKWSAYAGTAKLAAPATTVNINQTFGSSFIPGAPFGADNVTTGGYGMFELGKVATDQGCTPGSVTGGFLGGDSGTSTSAIAVTSQDTFAILLGEANSSSKTTLTLGLGAVYVG
jgi:hypothetical protein